MSRKAWFWTLSIVGGTGSAASSSFLFPVHAAPNASAHIRIDTIAMRDMRALPAFLRTPITFCMSSPQVPADADRKTYDEAYFAKWYHDPRTRVHTPQSVRRKVRMVVGVAEYFLRRKVRSVLDVGAGEGAWRAELRRLRPEIRYVGIDPSEYVLRR